MMNENKNTDFNTDLKNNLFYSINWVLLLITFVITRFMAHAYCGYLWFTEGGDKAYNSLGGQIGSIIINSLNIHLFYNLIKSECFLSPTLSRKKK